MNDDDLHGCDPGTAEECSRGSGQCPHSVSRLELLQAPDWAAVRARVTVNPGIARPELCVTTCTPHYLALLIADEAIGR